MRVLSSAAFRMLIALATTVCSARLSRAQDDPLPPLADYLIRSYSASDGLTSESITALAQTPDGFLYVATSKGLYRFDSRQFEQVPLSGFASTFVEALHTDPRGRLWIRSSAMDIGYIENGAFHFLGRLPVQAYDITSTHDGLVWTSGIQGLVRISATQRPWFRVLTRADGLPSDTVAGLYETQDGEWIVPSAQGLTRVVRDPRARDSIRFETFYRAKYDVTTSSAVRNDAHGLWVTYLNTHQTLRYHDRVVDDMSPDRISLEDFAWSSTDEMPMPSGLSSRMKEEREWVRASWIGTGRTFGRVLMQRDGTRWIDLRKSPPHSELARLRPSGKPELIDVSDRPDWSVVTSMLEDREGSVWIGTDRGLLQFVRRRARAVAQREGLPRELLFPTLQTRDGSVWAGTWGEGLFRFAHGGIAQHLTAGHGIPNDNVRSLFESSDSALWIGMRNVAARMVDGRVVEQFPVKNEVRAFAETPDHVVWIAGASEVVARLPDGRLRRIRTSDSDRTWSIFAEPTGSLLIGTQRGLLRLNPEAGTLAPFAGSKAIGGAFVTGIVAEHDGTVWIATFDRGLYRLREDGADHLDASNGVPNAAGFLVDDRRGGIWLSGYDGVWRVSRDSLHAVADDIAHGRPQRLTLRPVPYGKTEGAPGSESNRASPAGWLLRDGRLIFDNSNGLTVIDPADSTTWRQAPRTTVLSTTADGQRVAITDGRVALPAQTRRLDISFATLSFIAPRQHRFRYRLDGFDHGWTEAAESRTAYTNLPPGRYTFRVQSVPPPGTAWPNSEAAEIIDVPAMWWQTRLFGLAVVVALGAAIYGLYRLRLSQALAIHRVRATIASDLHDDLGSSINSIALMTQLLERDTALDGSARHLLTRIQRATQETATSVRHLVWLVDPTHTDTEFLLLRLRRVAGDLLPSMPLEFDVAVSVQSRPLSMTAMRNLLLVFKEALNNIAKHANATRVEIRVAEARGALMITICDDGAGFAADRVDFGHGLENMRRRTQELGGDLVVESVLGRGTSITFAARLL